MILKRQEKDGIIKGLYESTNILGSTYNNNTSELILIFKSGARYKYPNVSKSDYMRFELGDSQGSVFNKHIKKYSYEKMDDVDPVKIIAEAENIKKDEHNAKLKELLDVVIAKVLRVKYILDFDNNKETLNKELAQLESVITPYLSHLNNDNGKVI